MAMVRRIFIFDLNVRSSLHSQTVYRAVVAPDECARASSISLPRSILAISLRGIFSTAMKRTGIKTRCSFAAQCWRRSVSLDTCALHDQSMNFLDAELIADANDRTIGNSWKSGDRFLNDFRINLVAAYIEPCLLAAAND